VLYKFTYLPVLTYLKHTMSNSRVMLNMITLSTLPVVVSRYHWKFYWSTGSVRRLVKATAGRRWVRWIEVGTAGSAGCGWYVGRCRLWINYVMIDSKGKYEIKGSKAAVNCRLVACRPMLQGTYQSPKQTSRSCWRHWNCEKTVGNSTHGSAIRVCTHASVPR